MTTVASTPPSPQPAAPVQQAAPAAQPSIIVDVDVPFSRLVLFFIKAGLAAIPAIIAVWVVVRVVLWGIGALAGLLGYGWGWGYGGRWRY
jgi:hypothetical protein